MKLNIKIAGHLCHDIWGNSHMLGGAASYGALLAAKLGHRVTIYTSFGADFAYENIFTERGIIVQNMPSATSTVYDNNRREDTGEQQLLSRAYDLSIDDTFVNDADIIFLAPIADELVMDNALARPKGLAVGLLQGWLRDCSSLGIVQSKALDLRNTNHLDIAIVSQSEYDQCSVSEQKHLTSLDQFIITKGSEGTLIHKNGRWTNYPINPAPIVDATGAGDIFSMAYAISYKITQNIDRSMTFAQAAAAISISGQGIEAIPDFTAIERRMEHMSKI